MNENSRLVRSHRRGRHQSEKIAVDKASPGLPSEKIKAPWLLILGLSLGLSLLSIGNPFLQDFADSIQSQALYAGQAMRSGYLPYAQFYGTDGLIYYFMMAVGTFPGVAIAFQTLALYLSGFPLYKLIYRLTEQQVVGRRLLIVFYLLVAALGFGGLHASIFALPFVLNALWLLVSYFNQEVRDEAFISYGVYGGLTFLIHPQSSLLWVVATFCLLTYNIGQKRFARGFYQMLATLLGLGLVIYSVGYYTVWFGNFGPAIEQTVVDPLLSLGFWGENRFVLLLYGLLVLLLSGLLSNLVYGVLLLTRPNYRQIKVLFYLMLWSSVIVGLASPNFSSSDLISILPYGLVLSGLYMVHGEDTEPDEDFEDVERAPFEPKSFLAMNAYLPIAVCIFLLAYPIFLLITGEVTRAERTEIASYIKTASKPSDRIYAWDTNAMLYVESQRLSPVAFMTPNTYVGGETAQSDLLETVIQTEPEFIIVKRTERLPEDFGELLLESYEAVDLKLQEFTLYQSK